jgi:5-methylcytosine-specific restriction endonuclease McrA
MGYRTRQEIKEKRTGLCELCSRDRYLTFHHLIPRALHGKKRYRKNYTLEEMRSQGLFLCKLCHDGIHDLLTEKELGESFNTKEQLLTHEGVAKHLVWVRKQK